MKKRFFLFLILFFFFFLPAFGENESYDFYFYFDKTLYYPEEDIRAGMNLYYSNMDKTESFDESVILDIYKIPGDLSDDKYEEYFSDKEPLTEIKTDVKMENDGYDYWEGYASFELPGLPMGNYYAVCSTPLVKDSMVLRVNKLGISVKVTGSSLILFVQDRKSGRPIERAEVSLYADKEIKNFFTDNNGIVKIYLRDIKGVLPGKSFRVMAGAGEDSAEITVTVPVEEETFKGYIYTDRPVYRPEQKVNFKGIFRIQEGDLLGFMKGEKIGVTVRDPEGAEIYKDTYISDKYGAIDGSFTLEAEPSLGNYYIYCTNPGGKEAYGSFLVDEYRKPEFEISVIPEKEHYLQGDIMNFTVKADYYFGSPVTDTEFTYEIYRNYYYPSYGNYWWEEDALFSGDDYYGGEFIKRDGGITDKNGRAVISCEAEKLDYDATYKVIIRMTDKSRREVVGSVSILITGGAFYITVMPERYYYEPGEEVNLKIEAKDYSGKPVEIEGDLKIKYERYDEREQTWSLEELEGVSINTDENGICHYKYKPSEDGYYEIECTAEDQNKNKIDSSAYFYCYSGMGYYNWYNYFSSLEIIPDKNIYEPGDRADFFIVCPFEGLKGLVTVEGEKIFLEEVIDFSNGTGSFSFDIKETHAPNFYVTVSFFHDNRFYYQSKKILCPAKDNFLTLTVEPDREKYKPRDTAKFIIKTVDFKNKPVSSQVTMGLADESVYAVAGDTTPNMQKFFYGLQQNETYTYGSDGSCYGGPVYYHGRTKGDIEDVDMDGRETTGEEGGETTSEEATSFVQPEFTREYFPDTAYFNPNIITDHKGEAEVILSMPDTLTTWRATARAVTGDTKVGETTKEVTVTKNLLARLITTRFYTERDEALITAIVHNYLNSAKMVQLTLEIDGKMELMGDSTCKIPLSPDGEKAVDWKVKVKSTGDCKIKLTAFTDEESDAVELTVPVLPHGTERYVAIAGSTKDTAEEEIILSSQAEKGSSEMLITLEPSLASTVLSSLEYLTGYPYGCVEQTMNRFLPNIIVSKTLDELDIHNEKLDAELPKMVEEGFERLYGFHHSDGGWGWWENDESHPYMTAYVVYGLSLSKEAGYGVDEKRLQAGIKWLQENYEKEEDLNTRAYMAFAITMAGTDCKKILRGLYEKRQELNSYSDAVIALSLKKAGMEKEAKEMADLLEKKADETATTAVWSGLTDSHGWADNQVETTAYCLSALLFVKPDSKLIPGAVRFLTLNRKGYSWYSTKDTAAAVMALTAYVKITKELEPDFTADVTLNGTKIKSLKFTKNNLASAGEKIEIPYEGGLMEGSNKVKIEMNGKGMLYYAVYLKYYTGEENIKPTDSGFKVERNYYLLNPGEKDEKKAKILLGNSGELKVKSQDIILVELTVTGAAGSEYLIIEDPKPAGCEYDAEQRENYTDWNYWYTHREERDEKIAYFSTYFPPGTQKITYRLRAETPGIFHVMPARAYLMYSSETGGNSHEIILTVEKSREDESLTSPLSVTPAEDVKTGMEKVINKEKEGMTQNSLHRNLLGFAVMILMFLVFGFFFLSSREKN